MAKQTIGATRKAQRTAGSVANANFTELFDRQINISLDARTAAGSFSVPAGYILEHIVVENTTANAVTGGIKLGKTAGATDIVSAFAVAGNSLSSIPGASISARIFSKTAAQLVYYDAVTAWNSASLNFRVTLRKMY